MITLICSILADTSDPQIFIPAGFGLASAIAAVLATARYIKRTEDDTVDNLREQTAHLEERCAKCEVQNAELRVEAATLRQETRLLHDQVWFLRRVIANSGIEMPGGFPE